MMKKKIIGSGGGKSGGGTARVAQEASDSLQSRAYARIVDLISEGEIEGLVNGLQSVYLDQTPLQNADGSVNFSDIEFDFRLGTPDQSFIPGFSSAENEIPVGVEVKKFLSPGDPDPGDVVRTITNTNVSSVRVRVSFPQLTSQNTSNGDLTGTIVDYAIDVNNNGGGFVTKVLDKVNGKSTSKYERSYRIVLDGPGPWQIRVRRITADSTSAALQNRLFWESFTEIVDAKFRYPNSALIGLSLDSAQFSNIPNRAYDVKLLRIKVPTNYSPVDRSYDGIWDGLFYTAWTDNPAWVFYDLITNERYGLGSYIPEDQVDKWALYEIAKYCDELVPDGFGGTEPRFTCNAYIQSRQEAYQVIKDFASIFRGMVYWAGGTLTVVQDAPTDPVYLFTRANVVDGSFNYQGSSLKSRHTVALVSWNDPTDFYRQKVEYVEDTEGIQRYGVIETQVTAFGCTSRSQANRVGRWLLYSERNQTETVSFKTGVGGAVCRPGNIVKVADPTRSGSRIGGRILAATTTQITLDQVASFNAFESTISVMLPDGTIEDRIINDVEGSVVTLASALSAVPQVNSVWIVSSTTVEPQLFKIISVSEATDGTYEIQALVHDPNKYDEVELGLELEPRNISDLSVTPSSPTNLQITETLYEVNAEVRVKVTISWNAVPYATGYIVQYKRDDQNIISLPETQSNDVEILNAEPSIYEAKVWALNGVGLRSQPSTVTKRVLGKAYPPGDVTGFSLIPDAGRAYLSWNKATDLDVLIGGTVRIRHTPLTEGAQWRNSVDIVPALPGNATRVEAPLLVGTYMAKFVDSSGNASQAEAAILTTVPAALELNVVETIVESPGFAGNKTDMVVDTIPGYPGIAIASGVTIDEVEDIDTLVNFDYAGGVLPEGIYEFENYVDLVNVFTCSLTAKIDASSVDITDNIDQRSDLCDDWIDIDGDYIDDVNAELELRTTEDDPADVDAVWTPWKRFFVGQYRFRGIKFRLISTSQSESHNIVVQDLQVTIDMPDRIVSLNALTSSGSGFYTVTYPGGAFAVEPTIGITALNGNSGDTFEITNKTRAGFDIKFKNAASTVVSRDFNVYARGYGRQLD